MIKNISNETLTLMWAGIARVLKPGESFDVRTEYNAADKQIVALEDRFVGKFKGKIEKYEVLPQNYENVPVIEDLKAEVPKKRIGRPRKG